MAFVTVTTLEQLPDGIVLKVQINGLELLIYLRGVQTNEVSPIN